MKINVCSRYNFCRGNIDEIKQRGRDFIETWVRPYLRIVSPEWEHMTKCLIEGLRYYTKSRLTFNQAVVFVADLLNINMPHTKSTLTYAERLHLMLLR